MSTTFDLVWATMGVLCWIADLPAWMRAAAKALAPGGKLVVMDGVLSEPAAESAGYPDGAGITPRRRVIERGWDYATPFRTGPQVQFQHSLHAIVSAARQSGFRVTHLEEHTSISTHLCMNGLLLSSDGRYRKPDGKPVLFTLVAEHLT
jgi:SAM-dependent methyltransferase